ncbi:MAG: hypothetical protein Q7T49_00890 [bacterium]|nr:hypothetical protein [bacterium]
MEHGSETVSVDPETDFVLCLTGTDNVIDSQARQLGQEFDKLPGIKIREHISSVDVQPMLITSHGSHIKGLKKITGYLELQRQLSFVESEQYQLS